MFQNFRDVLEAIGDLVDRGLVRDYAISGATAQLFWDEAIPTFDVDVLILVGWPEGVPLTLEPLYEWANEKDYPTISEHIRISGIPVQFMPVPDDLSREAVQAAKTLELGGLPVKVVAPEYLISLWLHPHAKTPRRRERAQKLREALQLDEVLLADIMARYNLSW